MLNLLFGLLLCSSLLYSDQFIMNKNKGLYTNSNEFSDETPVGAMTIAENVVIDKTNIVEPRRGFQNTMALPNASDRVDQIYYYDGKLLAHTTDNVLEYWDGAAWQVYSGTYSAADTDYGRLKSAKGQGNIYFATQNGVKKLDNYNSAVVDAGIPKALDTQVALYGGVSGFMDTGNQVAYRVVWGYKDANNNLLLGSPSQRAVIVNDTGTSDDVSITFTIPDGITVNHFYQVYRSAMSGGSAIVPNDELQLVDENNPTAGEISAKQVIVTDSTPDSLRGAILYSSPSQEGILQSNEQPPFAKDVAQFKNNLFYANTKTKQNIDITLLAVGGAGVVADDTISIANVVFTAKATESTALCQFAVSSSGSASQNIDNTAQSLVKVINKCSTNTSVYAYYMSGVDDLPGKILLEARTIAVNAFSVSSNRGAAWNPNLTTTRTSVNNENQNYIYWSKTNEFEAVPLLNYAPVGNAGSPIKRIVPLRESLLIFKDDGIFRLVGETPENFFVDVIDNSTILYSPDSAVALNNLVFALTNQGVVSTSDTGVSIVSRNIENTLLTLFGSSLEQIKKYAFGVNYDTDRKYILFTPKTSSDTYPATAYVYNYVTSAWTEWPIAKRTGLVHPTEDKLYLSGSSDNYLYKERKNYNHTDYADSELSRNITVTNGVIVIDDSDNVEVGDILYSASTLYDEIETVDADTKIITTTLSRPFSTGAVTIYKAYECDIEYAPQTVGNPSVLKQFREASFLFKNKNFFTGQIGFSSNMFVSPAYVDFTGSVADLLWGLFDWGEVPWGGTVVPSAVRTWVPMNIQRATWIKPRLKVRSGFGQFLLNGYTLNYNLGSETPIK